MALKWPNESDTYTKLDANNRQVGQLKNATEKVLSKQRKVKFNKVVSNLKSSNVSVNKAAKYEVSCRVSCIWINDDNSIF